MQLTKEARGRAEGVVQPRSPLASRVSESEREVVHVCVRQALLIIVLEDDLNTRLSFSVFEFKRVFVLFQSTLFFTCNFLVSHISRYRSTHSIEAK